jgi:hypothetical protein
MADKKISALTAASTPLAGTEVLPIVQSGATVKVAVSDLTAGRTVSASAFTGPLDGIVGGTTPAAGTFTTASTTGNLTAAVQVKSTNSTSTTQKYVIEKVYDLYKGNGPTTLDICDITSTYSSGAMFVLPVVIGMDLGSVNFS